MNVPRWRSEPERYAVIALCLMGAALLLLNWWRQ